jgi:alpha-1,6-mannosyltransferase
MGQQAIWRTGIIVCFVASLFLVNWQADRTNFAFIAFFYTLAFAAYLLLLRETRALQFKHFALIALSAQIVSLLYAPNLSEDYFRFLWDGELALNGINPFDFTPNELVEHPFMDAAYSQELFAGISDLSRRNYSCYPPVNQVYFIVSSSISSSVFVNVIAMKVLIVLTEILGVIYLRKLLMHFKIDPSRLWIVYLNPLLIIECTGNTHFEGVMISLLFVALYFLFASKSWLGAIIFGLAVQIKLVPLIILPFFLRYFSLRKSVFIYLIIGATVLGLAMTQINAGNVAHFLKSLALYFRVFEFNSFLFYNLNSFVKLFTGYNPLSQVGPILSLLVLISIVWYALRRHTLDWKVVLERMLFGFFLYLILGSTVHPWYILPLVALSVFTNYAFPVVWSLLIFFSYFFYSAGDGNSFEVRLMVSIEYILFLAYFIYEWRKNGSPFAFLRVDHYFQPKSEA